MSSSGRAVRTSGGARRRGARAPVSRGGSAREGWLGAAVLALAVAACTSGAPPGFAGGFRGDRWAFPLVGPLEDGLLLTPVTINTHGPFLFLIDPDAPVSIVDGELIKLADLRPVPGPQRLDETDTQRTRGYAELLGVEIGSLIVERREAMVVARHTYDAAGRRVHGVLGRDVIADSLVLGVDRDRGLAHLVVVGAFQPPAGAAVISYAALESHVLNAREVPLPRRLVRAEIGGQRFSLHVDLGAVASQLREGLWARAGLVARDVEAVVVDEVGTPREVRRGSDVAPVTVAAAPAPVTAGAAFIPYAERRWEPQEVDGALGLGFFAGHAVWASWHTGKLHLAPRRPVAPAVRIARWDSPVLARCKNPGCVEIRVIDPLGGQPPAEGKPHPGVVLSITREEPAGGMDLEVVLEAQGAPGLPLLIVNLPQQVDRLIHQLKPDFLGRPLTVVDASPYPRRCPGGGGCVDQLTR